MKFSLLKILTLIVFIIGLMPTQAALAVPYVSSPLTNSPYLDFDPQINNHGHVVWAGEYGSDFEIYLFDGTTTTQLTDNETSDMYPQVNAAGNVVWEGHDGTDTEIYLYNGATIIQLTDNSTNDRRPLINDNGLVVWEGNDGSDSEILIFNGTTTVQLTNNSQDDVDPHLNNLNHVVWTAEDEFDPVEFEYEHEVFLYNGTATIQLTDNFLYDRNPQINANGSIVWRGHDGNDWEIFFSDGSTVTQITDNSYNDYDPQINNDNVVVWDGAVNADNEIFMATPCTDADNDGHCLENDCDDNDPAVNPGNQEICHDGLDNDCDPVSIDNCPPTTVEISADPSTFPLGGSTVLSWNAENAKSVTIDQGLGAVMSSGALEILPVESMTYTITAIGPGGTVSASVDITVDPYPPLPEIKLTAGDAAISNQFGKSVDISGNFALVGSQYDDDIAVDAGSAYVYLKENTGWSEQEKLLASDGEAGDNFGSSVAVSGQYSIVGAAYADYSIESSGAAYIFKYDGTNWIEQTKIVSSASGIKNLGKSVAINSDYAVSGGSGHVLIYQRDGDAWIESARLSDPLQLNNPLFGQSISVHDNKIIIGSRDIAHIYDFNGLEWTEQARLSGPADSNFGECVSITDNYAVVGAMHEAVENFWSAGAVYVYHNTGTEWLQHARLIAGDPNYGNGFGSSVDIFENFLLVGAKGFGAESSNRTGWAYIFKRNDETWIELSKIIAGNAVNSGYFGTSSAIDGATAIIGSNGDNHAGYNSGSAYIYEIPNVIVEFEADPEITPSGESTLSWRSFNADFCSIEPGIGIVELNGSLPIITTETMTYTLTCSNAGESAATEATVTVGYPSPAIIADISADAIQFGETAAISWTTLNADSVIIDHGVGSMPANGSVSVTPTAATTVYTITAIGPGGEESTTVSVSIVPTIAVNAEPGSIRIGESTTLTLSTQFADSCTIEPEIGEVPCNGVITVTPAEISSINTYTAIATGPGGTASKSIDIDVSFPPPSVTFNAFMLNYYTYHLEWTTANANDCRINQGIGNVPVTGTKQGYISQNTVFTITVSGPGGTVTASRPAFVGTEPAPLIVITSPQQGEQINRPDIMVEGYVFHSGDHETGVTINGIPALVHDNRFVANHIPLLDGQNIITAVATDFTETTSQHAIMVHADTTTDYIKLITSKESGLSPLDFTLTIDGTFNVIDPLLSYTGPGVVSSQPGSDSNELDISLDSPGLYFFYMEATDANSDIFRDSVAVLVLDKTALDDLLRAKWEGMKTAMNVQDINGASNYITEQTRSLYIDIYSALHDTLPQIIQGMQDIQLIYLDVNIAKYRIRKNRILSGQQFEITHYIYFAIDKDGLWKIFRY